MHHFKTLENRIIKHDLINKYKYKNIKSLPKLKNIILNFGCHNFNIQEFAINMLAMEIIASKKGTLTLSKSPNVLLKIQKGQPAGCKIILKKKEMYTFLDKLLVEIVPRLSNFSGFNIITKTSTASFKVLNEEILLQELEKQYPLFKKISNLDIHIFATTKDLQEFLFLLKSIKLPVTKKALKLS